MDLNRYKARSNWRAMCSLTAARSGNVQASVTFRLEATRKCSPASGETRSDKHRCWSRNSRVLVSGAVASSHAHSQSRSGNPRANTPIISDWTARAGLSTAGRVGNTEIVELLLVIPQVRFSNRRCSTIINVLLAIALAKGAECSTRRLFAGRAKELRRGLPFAAWVVL